MTTEQKYVMIFFNLLTSISYFNIVFLGKTVEYFFIILNFQVGVVIFLNEMMVSFRFLNKICDIGFDSYLNVLCNLGALSKKMQTGIHGVVRTLEKLRFRRFLSEFSQKY